MKIVLFGQKWLAAEVLKAITALPGVDVVTVCPDTETPDVLRRAAFELGIPSSRDMDALPRCDMAVAAHCQRYIPTAVRSRCGLGVLAYHPSLLPRHRGRDAVKWAVAMRDPITGGTVYWMDDGQSKLRNGAMSCPVKPPRRYGGVPSRLSEFGYSPKRWHGWPQEGDPEPDHRTNV